MKINRINYSDLELYILFALIVMNNDSFDSQVYLIASGVKFGADLFFNYLLRMSVSGSLFCYSAMISSLVAVLPK